MIKSDDSDLSGDGSLHIVAILRCTNDTYSWVGLTMTLHIIGSALGDKISKLTRSYLLITVSNSGQHTGLSIP